MKVMTTTVMFSACLTLGASLLAIDAWAQGRPEPGATPGVEITNLSKNTPKFGSVFPAVAVSRGNPNLVVVAWRTYSLPALGGTREERLAECHLSISKDGGKTFIDRNMTDVEKAYGSVNGQPIYVGCNSPWVSIAKDDTIYYGAYMLAFPSASDPPGVRRGGSVAGVSASSDGGATWSKMSISLELNRFSPDLVPKDANGAPVTNAPGDGHFGFVDQQTGTLYAGTRVYGAASDDKGKSFGPVYQAKGTAGAGFGMVVGAEGVETFPGKKCPCLVFSVSADKGKTFTGTVLAEVSEWNPATRTLGRDVRYPVSAVSPAKAGSYAVPIYSPDQTSIKVHYTNDGGKTWKTAVPGPVPANVPINQVTQVGIGYTADGRILLTWRGFRNPGAFNTFVAMLDGDKFGPTIKVSPALSIYPPLTYAGTYGNGNGAGDFTTWVTGNNTDAFVAFPYMPGGAVEDTYVARVPLALLK